METFEIKQEEGYKKLICTDRKLEIMVIERLDIPTVPDHFEVVWGVLRKKSNPHFANKEVVICFCMESRYDDIQYEPLLRPMLVADAMAYYVYNEWGNDFDEVKYSEGFKSNFLMPLRDKKKWTSSVREYFRSNIELGKFGLFNWKVKYTKHLSN